jgi:hypothetical protein
MYFGIAMVSQTTTQSLFHCNIIFLRNMVGKPLQRVKKIRIQIYVCEDLTWVARLYIHFSNQMS